VFGASLFLGSSGFFFVPLGLSASSLVLATPCFLVLSSRLLCSSACVLFSLPLFASYLLLPAFVLVGSLLFFCASPALGLGSCDACRGAP
jgi:hypothetical protein